VTATYSWSDASQLDSVDYGGGGVRVYTYDDAARLDTDTWTSGASTPWAVTYGYDSDGNVTSRDITAASNPSAGSWTYTYDQAGRTRHVHEPGRER